MPCINLAQVPALKAMAKPRYFVFRRHVEIASANDLQLADNSETVSATKKPSPSRPNTIKIPHARPALSASRPALSLARSTLSLGRSARPSRADLINAESRLGSTLFGPVPAGHRREFFHDRNNIWIWHEDWTDETSHNRQITIRYEVRTSGVYKKIAAGKYFKLEGEELENFRKATHAYLHLIKKHLYNHPASAQN